MTDEGERTVTGGCQCGRLRYEARVRGRDAYLCHCRMCQRATGGFAAAFVFIPRADITWNREPDWYASSPIARRPFCAQCGTPLGFVFNDGTDMDLTLGSFDDPGQFLPVMHVGIESMHEAWVHLEGLPRETSAESASVSAQWAKIGREVP